MKLPSEVDTYTFDELADCQDFDHNDKFVAFDKAAELWSHIIELREALEILDDVCDGEIGCWCGKSAGRNCRIMSSMPRRPYNRKINPKMGGMNGLRPRTESRAV